MASATNLKRQEYLREKNKESCLSVHGLAINPKQQEHLNRQRKERCDLVLQSLHSKINGTMPKPDLSFMNIAPRCLSLKAERPTTTHFTVWVAHEDDYLAVVSVAPQIRAMWRLETSDHSNKVRDFSVFELINYLDVHKGEWNTVEMSYVWIGELVKGVKRYLNQSDHFKEEGFADSNKLVLYKRLSEMVLCSYHIIHLELLTDKWYSDATTVEMLDATWGVADQLLNVFFEEASQTVYIRTYRDVHTFTEAEFCRLKVDNCYSLTSPYDHIVQNHVSKKLLVLTATHLSLRSKSLNWILNSKCFRYPIFCGWYLRDKVQARILGSGPTKSKSSWMTTTARKSKSSTSAGRI